MAKNFLLFLIVVFLTYESALAQKAAGVSPNDLIGIKIIMLNNHKPFGTGTGFIVKHNGVNFLITNLHNFSGIDYYTGKFEDTINHKIPDEVIILAHKKGALGEWVEKKQPLIKNNVHLWNEINMSNLRPADVVSLKLADTSDISIYQAQIDSVVMEKTMILTTTTPLYISGYPYGLVSSKNYPIWKFGILSSIYEDEPFGLPVFLIDAHTHPGMFGSPVLLIGRFSAVNRKTKTFEEYDSSGILLGIFSGNNPSVEMGVVWKYEVIQKLLSQSH